jgi:hypothetical protein
LVAGGAGRLVAPLSSRDTLDQQDAHMQALARLEASALGLPTLHQPHLGGADVSGAGAGERAAAIGGLLVTGGRQERAMKWAHGALARALEERQERIRWGAAAACLQENA